LPTENAEREKMKILMVSKVFPAGHPRAGEPTDFLKNIQSGRKVHTIRANEKGRFKDGDVVEVRQWSGRPYRSTQERTGLVIKIGVEPVRLGLVRGLADFYDGNAWSFRHVASKDGLPEQDFADWFFPHGQKGSEPWTGCVIHFTNFRYVRKGAALADAI
jgi:hypothetical protein